MSWLGDPHLGARAASLVDGELGDDARDHALAHLAWCEACRAEVAAQRRLKARLGRLRPPDAPDPLVERLLAASAQPDAPPSAPSRAVERRRRPLSTHPRRVRRARVAVVAGVGAAASVAAAFAVGEPHQPPPVTPSVSQYVNQHAVTSDEMPLGRPGGGAAATVSYAGTAAP